MFSKIVLICHSVAKYSRKSLVKQADEFGKEMELVDYLHFFSVVLLTLSRSLNDDRHLINTKTMRVETEVAIDTRENKERGQKYKYPFSSDSSMRIFRKISSSSQESLSSDLLNLKVKSRCLKQNA